MRYYNILIALYFAIINSCSPVVQADEVTGAINPYATQETEMQYNWHDSYRRHIGPLTCK